MKVKGNYYYIAFELTLASQESVVLFLTDAFLFIKYISHVIPGIFISLVPHKAYVSQFYVAGTRHYVCVIFLFRWYHT